ncbi:unnamed protein product [Trichogramma brassicae]|uniref:Uncharacterized protein n=1 Tax=Trichogramma brassicae TaxID=86971 RepID=A0A6H5IU17_9HYME|nr:unnamed protein product [Trichogramma brassicae]
MRDRRLRCLRGAIVLSREKLEQESDQISVGTRRARGEEASMRVHAPGTPEPDYRCSPIGPCALDNRGNRRAPLPATAVYHNNNASIGSSSKDTTLMQTFVQRRTCASSCIIWPVSTRLPPLLPYSYSYSPGLTTETTPRECQRERAKDT